MGNFVEVTNDGGYTDPDKVLGPINRPSEYLQQNPGGVEVDCRTGATKTLRSKKVTSEDLRPAGQNNIMATAKTPWGTPVNHPSEINDRTIITVKGVSTELGLALRVGAVVKNPDGTYSEPGGSSAAPAGKPAPQQAAPTKTQAPAQQQAAPQQQAAQKVDIFTPGNRQNLAALNHLMGSTQTQAILAKASASLAFKDGDATGVAREMADRLKLDPKSSEAIIDGIMQDVQNFGVDYLTKALGVDGEAAFGWMYDNVDPAKTANILNALCYGDVSMMGWLAEQYRLSQR